MNQVMINPPIKKPITATKEGSCRSAKPDMACPEVQPPAYLAPNPIRNPPKPMMIIPRKLNKDFHE